jgi:hypothetical protein
LLKIGFGVSPAGRKLAAGEFLDGNRYQAEAQTNPNYF